MSSVNPTNQDLSNDTTFSQIKSRVPVPLRTVCSVCVWCAYVGGHEGEALLQLGVGHGPGQQVRVVLAHVHLDGGVQLNQSRAQPAHLQSVNQSITLCSVDTYLLHTVQ